MKRLSQLRVLFWATLSIMVAVALVPLQTLRWATEAREDLAVAERERDALHAVTEHLTEAESAARGYVIAGRSDLLERYFRALGLLRTAAAGTGALLAGDPTRTAQWTEVLGVLDLRLKSLEAQVSARPARGLSEAAEAMRTGDNKRDMDRFEGALDRMVDLVDQRVLDATVEWERVAARSTTAFVGANVIDVMLLVVLFALSYRTVQEAEKAEVAQRATMEGLAGGLEELELRNRQITLLTELAVGLEAPSSMEESMRTIGLFGAQLFPRTSAAVYLFRPSLGILERSCTWGTPHTPDVLDPTSCWALRRGQPHAVRSEEHDLVCPHSTDSTADVLPQLCLPLNAHGDTLGLICMQAGERGSWSADDRVVALARAFSEQISLGLSSFNLREALRQQSVVDSLTGLNNRRYLDDTLRREVFRAQRGARALSIIMIDADHFKRINDIFGHDAGDVVLRALGRELKAGVRAGDLACRFGGEEFALVLPECGKPQAMEKAQRVANSVRAMHLVHGATTLPPLTISAGVATYPEDGEEAEHLIAAADRALYAAKRAGRDRVLAAQGAEGEPIEIPPRRF